LNRLGLNIKLDEIFTSGEATALYINQVYPGASVFPVVTPGLRRELLASGIHLVTQNPSIVLLGFDTTVTYKKLSAACGFILKGATYIATHPDINCPVEDGFIPDIGAIIAFIQAVTGKLPDMIIGKPNRPLLDTLEIKSGVSVDQMVIIGDRLYTDIAIGQFGAKTILVLTGETNRQDLDNAGFKPDLIVEDLCDLKDILLK